MYIYYIIIPRIYLSSIVVLTAFRWSQDDHSPVDAHAFAIGVGDLNGAQHGVGAAGLDGVVVRDRELLPVLRPPDLVVVHVVHGLLRAADVFFRIVCAAEDVAARDGGQAGDHGGRGVQPRRVLGVVKRGQRTRMRFHHCWDLMRNRVQ